MPDRRIENPARVSSRAGLALAMKQERPVSTIVSGVGYGQLFGGTSTGGGTDILSILYGGGTGTSTASPTGSPLTDLKLARAKEKEDVAKEAKTAPVARDIKAFKDGVAKARTIQDALSNPNVMKVLLTANNLSKYIQYPAAAKKALLSDPSKSDSLANRLGDSTLRNAAKSFNFAKNGLDALKKSGVIDSLSNGYAEVRWRESLESATPGLSNAMTFLNQAKSIKTADDILGDTVNRDVVLTALGVPREIAFQNLEAQEKAVSSRVDMAKFQDPKFVAKLTNQYLLNKQDQALTRQPVGSDLTSLSTRLIV